MKQLIRKILKEEVSERLKRIVKNKLSKELSHAEIILDDNGSIWFIDRENKYWYLQIEKSGELLWRYQFFNKIFELFSMGPFEFEPIIHEWVEDLLNRNVTTTYWTDASLYVWMEDLLNRNVTTTTGSTDSQNDEVEDVLNQN
jgi:hypothetical protein